MWIVQIALKRPYTFVVLAILILAMGAVAIFRTPTDIFPNINIPVVSIIWTYNGLVPREMSDRIVSITERNLTTVVDNIEHVESQSLYGIAVVKVFLQPNASLDRAVAQITASSQTQLKMLPQGTTPPLIIAYSASSVPVLQLALSGKGMSEQELNDFGPALLDGRPDGQPAQGQRLAAGVLVEDVVDVFLQVVLRLLDRLEYSRWLARPLRVGRCLSKLCGRVPQGACRNRLRRGPECDGRGPLSGGQIRSPAGVDG